MEMTIEERKKRQIEFCEKLKELIDEYAVSITIYDASYEPFHTKCLGIIVDAHILDSWDVPLFFKDLDSEPLESAIQDLQENGISTDKTICYGNGRIV